jgi:hypothetical protein
MRAAAFLLPLLLFIGCSSTRPDPNLPPQYAAAPDSDTVLSTPVYTLADDPGLNGFLAEVADAFLRHDWRALAYTVDANEYAAQFVFVKSGDRADADVVSQILEETFGLAFVERLRGIEFVSVEPAWDEVLQVDGHVMLDDQTSRSLSFTVSNRDGAWRVVVPQG